MAITGTAQQQADANRVSNTIRSSFRSILSAIEQLQDAHSMAVSAGLEALIFDLDTFDALTTDASSITRADYYNAVGVLSHLQQHVLNTGTSGSDDATTADVVKRYALG